MTILGNESVDVAVEELSGKDAAKLFDAACQRELGVSGKEFLTMHESGEYPATWDRAAISRLEFLLPLLP